MRILKHVIIILVVLFIVLGIPAFSFFDIPALFSDVKADAVSSASLEIPDQPSGEFYVFVKKEKYKDTLPQWETFFAGGDAGVIMEDIDLYVIDNDVTGMQLAERYKARLPENQMTMHKESGIMLSSKVLNDRVDCMLVSKEISEYYKLEGLKENGKLSCVVVKDE